MQVFQGKSVNPNYVAIFPLPLEQQNNEVLEKTEHSREKEIKKQNRGVVRKMGSNCNQWITEGDTVSFYRNAATPVMVGDEELMFVHEDHILASF